MARKRGVTEYLDVFQNTGAVFFDIEPDLLIVVDGQGNIERVNPAFERATGYHEADIRNTPVIQLARPEAYHPKILCVLHKNGGIVRCKLVAYRHRAQRVFLVMRKA